MQLEDYFDFLSEDDIRLRGHRLGIDNILEYFLAGYTAEAIREVYPELSLEKIYATITYYLQHQTEIDAYLLRLKQWREQRYQEWNRQPSPLIERLRAFKAERQQTILNQRRILSSPTFPFNFFEKGQLKKRYIGDRTPSIKSHCRGAKADIPDWSNCDL
ncbi:MAG: DUF433 domain-containing protein [Oculatellaceae cyanobacterium Prado106]|jgi:uncharacterized protein (DUF433 family)|nr:DUF433 domain-containing protein [Oculatellaceae cyanobacterium Prado106]